MERGTADRERKYIRFQFIVSHILCNLTLYFSFVKATAEFISCLITGTRILRNIYTPRRRPSRPSSSPLNPALLSALSGNEHRRSILPRAAGRGSAISSRMVRHAQGLVLKPTCLPTPQGLGAGSHPRHNAARIANAATARINFMFINVAVERPRAPWRTNRARASTG